MYVVSFVLRSNTCTCKGIAVMVRSTSDRHRRQAINDAGVSETSRVGRVERLQTDAATATNRTKGMVAAGPDSCSQP